ncbi:hypothetical protein C8Q78DRAFT_808508 [Trametes maxima]|nr:hypothetical protein C8Q78DRAFT_808508 [Trametes maxima]
MVRARDLLPVSPSSSQYAQTWWFLRSLLSDAAVPFRLRLFDLLISNTTFFNALKAANHAFSCLTFEEGHATITAALFDHTDAVEFFHRAFEDGGFYEALKALGCSMGISAAYESQQVVAVIHIIEFIHTSPHKNLYAASLASETASSELDQTFREVRHWLSRACTDPGFLDALALIGRAFNDAAFFNSLRYFISVISNTGSYNAYVGSPTTNAYYHPRLILPPTRPLHREPNVLFEPDGVYAHLVQGLYTNGNAIRPRVRSHDDVVFPRRTSVYCAQSDQFSPDPKWEDPVFPRNAGVAQKIALRIDIEPLVKTARSKQVHVARSTRNGGYISHRKFAKIIAKEVMMYLGTSGSFMWGTRRIEPEDIYIAKACQVTVGTWMVVLYAKLG